MSSGLAWIRALTLTIVAAHRAVVLADTARAGTLAAGRHRRRDTRGSCSNPENAWDEGVHVNSSDLRESVALLFGADTIG